MTEESRVRAHSAADLCLRSLIIENSAYAREQGIDRQEITDWK